MTNSKRFYRLSQLFLDLLFVPIFNAIFKNVAPKEGTRVIETSSEANKLKVMASANGLNISPTEPDTNTSGKTLL